MRHHSIRTATRRAVVLAVAAVLSVAGCASQAAPADPAASTRSTAPAFRILPEPSFGSKSVAPIDPVRLSVTVGSLHSIALANEDGRQVAGKLSADRRMWQTTEPLGFAKTYTWTGTAVDGTGEKFSISGSFQTVTPTTLVTASSNLLPGGVYPTDAELRVTFSDAIANRSVVERAMKVESKSGGSWSWNEDGTTALWRPKKGWQPGAQAKLVAKLYGLRMATGVYGATDLEIDFQIQQA